MIQLVGSEITIFVATKMCCLMCLETVYANVAIFSCSKMKQLINDDTINRTLYTSYIVSRHSSATTFGITDL